MQLFFNATSPYARKARVAVLEKGLAGRVTFVETDPWASPAELVALNPLSKVPTLVTDTGAVVTESDGIIQVLDMLGGHPYLLPPDGPARMELLVRSGLCQGLIDASFIAVIERRRPAAGQWDDWVARQRSAVIRSLAHIATSFVLSPARFDLGDIALACALGYLDYRHPDLPWRQQYPAMAAWQDTADQRPSMIATSPN
ncbi:glutathione S-transferase N-terminal domain-containing protein [Ferrovibrio terrae]|uniref:glutathione S-transferase N-terminal domain-containing protein n=1 Tax=Ferrovibrio terrae TaxID=2594003 RepID=UPI00313833E7